MTTPNWFLKASCRCFGAAEPPIAIVRSEAMFQRSEEHTSELQSQSNLVCRLLLEKKKQPISFLTSYSKFIIRMLSPTLPHVFLVFPSLTRTCSFSSPLACSDCYCTADAARSHMQS